MLWNLENVSMKLLWCKRVLIVTSHHRQIKSFSPQEPTSGRPPTYSMPRIGFPFESRMGDWEIFDCTHFNSFDGGEYHDYLRSRQNICCIEASTLNETVILMPYLGSIAN